MVHYHPVDTSYSAALCRAVCDGLERRGAPYRLIELHRGETADRSRLAATEHLIVVYPTWWGGLPARLLDWLQKTLGPDIDGPSPARRPWSGGRQRPVPARRARRRCRPPVVGAGPGAPSHRGGHPRVGAAQEHDPGRTGPQAVGADGPGPVRAGRRLRVGGPVRPRPPRPSRSGALRRRRPRRRVRHRRGGGARPYQLRRARPIRSSPAPVAPVPVGSETNVTRHRE